MVLLKVTRCQKTITHLQRNEMSGPTMSMSKKRRSPPPPPPAHVRHRRAGWRQAAKLKRLVFVFDVLAAGPNSTRRRRVGARLKQNEAACGAWYTYAENEAALPARLCLTCVVFSFLCSASAFTQSGMRRYSLATVQPCLIHGHTGSPFGQATRGGRPTPLSRRSRYRPRTSSRRPTRSPGSPSC